MKRLRRSPNAPRDPAAVRALRQVATQLLGRPASADEARRLLQEALAPPKGPRP